MPRSAAVDDLPCLLVKVNGKKVALMGVQGQGGVAATVSRWFDLSHAGEKRRKSRRDRAFNVRMDVTDASDPAWHRMYAWPASQIGEGDRSVRLPRAVYPIGAGCAIGYLAGGWQ